MFLKHINLRNNLPCVGMLMVDGMTIYGMRYRCYFCGKIFIIDSNGNIVM